MNVSYTYPTRNYIFKVGSDEVAIDQSTFGIASTLISHELYSEARKFLSAEIGAEVSKKQIKAIIKHLKDTY